MSEGDGAYRVELSVSNRAVCNGTQCKKEGTKIKKGEIRHGVLVTINEHQGFKWRHWGCLTPTMVNKWAEMSGGDMELVDGYDILPADLQEKVKKALEVGHVSDEDWNGDLEQNRPGKSGQYVRATKKKAKKEPSDTEGNDITPSPAKKKASKKRGQDDSEVDAAAEQPAKKARGRPKKAAAEVEDERDDQPARPQKKSRGNKAIAEPMQSPADNKAAAPRPQRRWRPKKAAAAEGT